VELFLETDPNSATLPRESRVDFLSQVMETTAFVALYLKKIKIEKVKHIRVRVTNALIEEQTELVSSVCSITLYSKMVDAFAGLGELEKKQSVVEVLRSGIMKCCIHFGWPTDVFLDAFNEVAQLNWYFIRPVWKKTKSADKRYEAQLCMQIGCAYNQFFLDVTEIKNKKQKRINVVRANYYLMQAGMPGDLIEEGYWTEQGRYVVNGHGKYITHEIDIEAETSVSVFHPVKGLSLEYLKDKLEYVTTDDGEKRRELGKIAWKASLLQYNIFGSGQRSEQNDFFIDWSVSIFTYLQSVSSDSEIISTYENLKETWLVCRKYESYSGLGRYYNETTEWAKNTLRNETKELNGILRAKFGVDLESAPVAQ
jgi:hypothetical protein